MKVIKNKKNRYLIGWSVKLIILSFIFYIIFTLINQHIQIQNKKIYLENLNNQLQIQIVKNNELKKIMQVSDDKNQEYFMRIARELNLAKRDERIFVNVSGN